MYEPNPEHVPGNFEWEVPPACQCGMLKNCFDERLIFVSNSIYEGHARCYVVLLNDKGEASEAVIQRCPWCGDEIKVRKVFPIAPQGTIDALGSVQ